MTDRQKLMSDLEGLTYDDWHMFHCDSDVQGIAIDALKLLKEQPEAEAVSPTITEGAEGEEVICCGSCGTSLYHLFPWIKINKAREFVQYCRHCGREVKWDD